MAEGEQLAAYLALNRRICDRWDLEVEVIPYRSKKDPRAIRVLDPACGSCHFLLYSFDLLQTIYREAWDDPGCAPFAGTGRRLQEDYPDRDAFEAAIPELILRHNLHGIDIDLRAVQIGQLALWLRAQRAYADLGLRPADRPPITRVNVVAAEPLPGELDLLAEFERTLDPPVLADLVAHVWDGMAGIGEIGSLLKAEDLVRRVVAEAKREWQSGRIFDQVTLFAGDGPPKQERLDLSFISDEAFWQSAERQVKGALKQYAESADGDRYRRRLFADDAAQGFAFLELFDDPFDVVLMNPPFGSVSPGARAYVERHYPKTKNDLYAAFVERGLEILCPSGYLGAITSRTGFFLTSFQKWREDILFRGIRIHVVADLGQGVLDAAMVETAAYALERIK
ncbi:MAG: BREX-1 system adenine-specific DNA-methyltransferase PglX [Chloroflexota bacterium]|nr:BREX-1 system adenine-specific DNA-methyltransferase PglX [Chloroflexota bacterium]